MTVTLTKSASLTGDTKKSSPTKLTSVKKNTGITVKRKSQQPLISNNNSKKGKKLATSSLKVPVAPNSFDLEATICPICDEACTCPKTTASTTPPAVTTVKSSNAKNYIAKKPVTIVKKAKPKKKKPMIIEEDLDDHLEDYDGVTESSETEEIIEDPALSFIRMIYSDEESLDEEEAYALYQATQLFSSSEEEEDVEQGYYSEYESDDYESHDDSENDEFEYTVVEYVQPSTLRKKKKTTMTNISSSTATELEFVAYESDSDTDSEGHVGNLLVNAKDPESNDSESSDCESNESGSDCESNENWLTYSVFDVDRDLVLTNQQQGQFVTSLSSHGAGTPETLLFSTSSSDKIPNIAPQVLAAISAAAKHMANANSNSDNRHNSSNSNGSSKYFSYITLRDPLRGEEVNEEEFLFFEDPIEHSDHGDLSNCSDECEIEDFEELSIISEGSTISDIEEYSSTSISSSSSSSSTTISINTSISSHNIPPPAHAYALPLNRWNRVPIGAFRRSRRPSVPNPFHQIHPSTALKTFSDPTSAALTLTTSTMTSVCEDSFDEAASVQPVPEHRSYSVVTWDELDMDIVTNNNPNGPCSPNSNNIWPLPKRSRSVMAQSSLSNNYEWLNNSSNWNWET